VSQDHTRKHFLAKFIGLIAATGLASRFLVRPAGGATVSSGPSASFQLQSEARAVARRADSI
jgi:hypothetical protein